MLPSVWGQKKSGDFRFVSYKGDHPPLHVHIEQGDKEIGRWDIENQKPMDHFRVTRRLVAALKNAGYMREEVYDSNFKETE